MGACMRTAKTSASRTSFACTMELPSSSAAAAAATSAAATSTSVWAKYGFKRIIVLDAEFQSFILPAAFAASMGFHRNNFRGPGNAGELGPYSFARELGLISFSTPDGEKIAVERAITRHFPLIYNYAAPSAPWDEPEAFMPTFCVATEATRKKIDNNFKSMNLRLGNLSGNAMKKLQADLASEGTQKAVRRIHAELTQKAHVWQELFNAEEQSGLIANCAEIVAVELPPEPQQPEAAAAAPAAAGEGVGASAAPAAAPADAAAADPAPTLVPSDVCKRILDLAQPIDSALWQAGKTQAIIPRSSFPASVLATGVFDDSYAAYDADPDARREGVFLKDKDAAVVPFLTALVAALGDPAVGILVKGSGDLPVLANTCAFYGVPFDLEGATAREVDISTEASYRFWRAVMWNGQLGPNASESLRLFREIVHPTATPKELAAAAPHALPAPAPSTPAAGAGAGAGVAAASPVPDAPATPSTPAAPAAKKPEERVNVLKLACLLNVPRVRAVAHSVLGLEGAVAAAAAAGSSSPPSSLSSSSAVEGGGDSGGDPLEGFTGGIFEPARAHNPLTDSYYTIVVGALQLAAEEELAQAHAAAAAEELLKWKVGRVSKALEALQGALRPPPSPPAAPADPSSASDGGGTGGMVVEGGSESSSSESSSSKAAAAAAPALPLGEVLAKLDAMAAAVKALVEEAAKCAGALDRAALFVARNGTHEGAPMPGWAVDRLQASGAAAAESSTSRKRAREEDSEAASTGSPSSAAGASSGT